MAASGSQITVANLWNLKGIMSDTTAIAINVCVQTTHNTIAILMDGPQPPSLSSSPAQPCSILKDRTPKQRMKFLLNDND
ncbi:hypothetical protein Tcan_08651 [Toxocara canis]|uniref:Uncharacterized protein n=1 Tax=Toxocara canis TaxID=6265 RepID=A0A0B2VZF5_TOXCA|nr:hypothetical protein Tcan_08651 [Toxocara canis]